MALQGQVRASVGWVAMRRNLLQQAQAENERHGIGCDLTPISMFEKNPPTDIDLLVVDEAQHDAASSMAHLHNVIQPQWILRLTATPIRCDRVKLCFDKVVKDAGMHQLIQDGYLSKYDHYTIPKWDVLQLTSGPPKSPGLGPQVEMTTRRRGASATSCSNFSRWSGARWSTGG